MTTRLPSRAGDIVEAVRADPPAALLCLIVLTLPLEFLRPLVPGGLLDVARLGMLAGIAWLAWRVFRERRGLARPPLSLVVATVAILAVEGLSFAFTRWPSAPKSLLAVGAFVAFGAFVVNSIRNRRAVTIVAWALVVSGAVEGLVMIAEQVGSFRLFGGDITIWLDRRTGTFWDPNVAARMLLLAIVAGLGLEVLGRSAGRSSRAIVLGACALMAFGLVLTLSRTGWILFVLVVAATFAVALMRRAGRLAPLVVVAAFALGLALNPHALGRASDLPAPEDGDAAAPGVPTTRTTTFLDPVIAALPIDDTRRYLLRTGVAMFEDHPLAGVGLGGFQPMILGPYRSMVPVAASVGIVSLEHTDVVRVAAEEGSLGLAAWAILLVAIVVTARAGLRRADIEEWAAIWILVSGVGIVLAASQTEGRYYSDPYLWLLIGALAAVAIRGPGWATEPSRRDA